MATVTSSKRQLTHTSNTYESNGDVTIGGNLNINGTTTTIDTANLLVEDKNIIIGDVSSPTDSTADGGGITLKGASDKTINWVNSTDSWTSNQRFSAPSLTLTSISATSGETSALLINSSNHVVKRTLGSNAFNSTSFLTGNQTITLSGDVSGSGTTSISVTVADDSHNHVISNVDGLQSALDGKLGSSEKAADSNLLDNIDSTRFIYGGTATGTTSISGSAFNPSGSLKSGFYRVAGTSSTIPNATSVNFVLHTSYDTVGNKAGFDLAVNDSQSSKIYFRPATGGGRGSWQTIWTDSSDGSGSGLDADLLDGNHASAFATASHTHAASDITSGTLATARIPSLAASKITSGTFADARIASASNWNTAYTDRNKWDGGSTGLNASTGRSSLGLGSAATSNTSAFAAAGDENIIDGATSIWNADGDGDVFTYDDSNPTHNGKYAGAVLNIRGDGSNDSSLVRAGVLTSDHVSTANGYYVGTLLGTTNSTTTQVINGSGEWTGNVIPAAKLSTATTQSSSENSTKIATTAYVKSQGYVTSSGNTIIGTDSDINTSGAAVLDQLVMTDGVITSHSTRNLTLADLGYTGATNANNYSLPAGSGSTRGGFKIGYTESGKYYPVEVDSSEKMFVNVPWVDTNTDTNTTYSAGTHLALSGTTFNLNLGATDKVLNIGHNATTNNEGEIILDTSNAGSPQIGFTEHGDASWAIGIDDGDNSFKIHGNANTTIPTINNLTTPLFEIATNGFGYFNGSRAFADNYHPNADTLTTARTIAGTSFNGSANIDISYNNLTNKPTIPSLSGYATEAHVSSEISNLVNGAPAALDTLNELAAAIDDNASYASSITTALSGKASLSGSNSFTNSYNEFGNSTGSVSNDGSWNARVNIAGSSHAKLDVKSVSDGIITTLYAHSGHDAGRIGTTSGHKVEFMTGGVAQATLNTNGTFYLGSNRVFADNYHPNADTLTTARTIALSGDVTGSVSFNGSSNVSISTLTNKLRATDDRDVKPSTTGLSVSGVAAIKAYFTTFNGMTGSSGGAYQDMIALDTYSDSSGGGPSAITFNKSVAVGSPQMYIWKGAYNGTTWGTGQRVFADNYHPNADTLTTARTIAGTSFNGSSNIDISYNNLTNKPTIPSAYSLPLASSSTRGGVKIGFAESGKNYPVELDSSEKMYVNVPWANTTYSAGTGLTLSGTTFSITDTISSSASNNTIVKRHSSGYIFANYFNTTPNTVSSGVTQICVETGNDGYIRHGDAAAVRSFINVASGANNYSLPAGSSSTRGGFKIGFSESGKNYPVETSSEKMYVNVPWTDTNTNTTYSAGTGITLSGTTFSLTDTASKLSLSGGTLTGDLVVEDSEIHVGDKSNDEWTRFLHTSENGYGFNWQHTNASVFVNEQGSTNQVMVLGDVDAGNSNSGLFGIAHSGNGGSSWTKKLDLRGDGDLYIGSSGTSKVFHDGYHPNADTLTTARTIAGTSFNGSSNIDISYNNLTNKPTIPTNNNQLSNGAGYVTSSGNTIIGTDSDIDTSGATVIDQLNMTDGVITSHSTRTLTLANLGYTGATNANNYSLPEATATERGGIELFSNTDQSVAANSVSATSGRTYGIQLNSAGQAVVNVPWSDTNTDTNTTYSAGRGLDLSGTEFQLETDLRDSINLIGLDSNDYLQWSNNSYLRSVVNGSERFRVNTSGIDVTGTATANAFRTDTGNTDYNVISRNGTSTTLWVQAAQSGSLQGIASFRYGSATVNQGTEVCAIRRNSSYFINTKLGVGTSSPSTALHVSGTITQTIYNPSSFPSASPAGQRAFAYSYYPLATSHGSVVSTYGSYIIPVYSDGSSWRAG